MEKDIYLSIKKTIANVLESDVDAFTFNSTFEELEIDSILFIRLVVQCETEYNIQFEDEMLLITKFQDVSTFVNYIKQRIEQNNASE